MIATLSEGENPIVNGRKVVTAAAASEPLVSVTTIVKYVIITAETDNTGVIVVGGRGVLGTLATRTGVPLAAGDSLPMSDVDLNQVYIDATVSGEGVTFMYKK